MQYFKRRTLPMQAVAGLALIAVLLIPQPNLAQDFYTIPLTGRPPAVIPSQSLSPSRADGQLRVDIGTNVILQSEPRFYGISAIAIQETGDEPCKVELYGKLLDPAEVSSDVLVGTARLQGCEGGRNESWQAATLVAQPHQFVRQVQGCFPRGLLTNHRKLKGLAVAPTAILDNSEMIELPLMPCNKSTPHCFARAHCDSWANVATCPSGQIVTGITMYHFAENNRPPEAFFAIQPHCRLVKRPLPELSKGPAKPLSP